MTVQPYSTKGEITIFLSLLLSSILALLGVTFKSAGNYSVKFQDEIAMDASLRSCFGEYHKELYGNYDLLYIDSSYRVSEASIENTEEHVLHYLQDNLDFDSRESKTDYFKIEAYNAEIEKYLIASDQQGLPMYYQAVNYLNEYGNAAHSNRIESLRSELPYMDMTDIFGGWDGALERVNSFGVYFINPAAIVRILSADGANQIISNRLVRNGQISYSNIPSKRQLKQGNYNPIAVEENELYFTEYLYQKCGSVINPKSDTVLSAEMEYLLYGKQSDKENVKLVIDRLIRIFANENLSYLYGDEGKKHEIKAYAEIIVPLPQDPEDPLNWIAREELVEAVADSLTYAWAQSDAILKADKLFNGGKMPGNSPQATWILPLTEMTLYLNRLGQGGGCGYSYEEYVCAFYKGLSRAIICSRFMDEIEMNMRSCGSPGFCIDGCIEYMQVNVNTNSIFKKEYKICRDYAYEEKYRHK